jgi:hypothetical protein
VRGFGGLKVDVGAIQAALPFTTATRENRGRKLLDFTAGRTESRNRRRTRAGDRKRCTRWASGSLTHSASWSVQYFHGSGIVLVFSTDPATGPGGIWVKALVPNCFKNMIETT